MTRGLVFLVLALPSMGRADPANAVIADVGLHVVGLGYQRTIASHVALQADAESYTPWTHETKFFDVTGYLLRIRAFYYQTAAPRGIWVSPFAQLGVVKGTRNLVDVSDLALAVGVSGGYAWLVRDRLHLVVGAGLQYDRARIGGQDTKPSFAGLWPQLDASIGYAF